MSNQTQLSTFNFEQNSIRTLSINNEPWFVAADICKAINLSSPSMAIANLDEDEKYTLSLTEGIEGIGKQVQELNLVSESGMYTLILRCRDAVKKGSIPHRFRKWVTAEVLPQIRKTGKYQLEPKQLALPEPEKKFTFEFTEHELQLLPWIWFIALRGTETCRMIYPAMETIGSKFSGAIYGQAYEYRHTIREVHKLLKRLTADFQYDYESNWRVLKHLNNYNPKSNNYQVI
ncbi:hypothetical protein MUU45_001141 [Rodentibacter pneumotropicus]|uniref:Bro-N domain-containing protein n=1 Tax=Rodentibacter pneumotropicus TaxID=758 RepID=A0AAW5LDP4_9PAST|nr:P22AR C-terminal domain-containing protein [Rodentibacter pneumotropicus]MCQ9121591.1 hypothetical protein [Rodentibacter pneumotropicus]